MTALLQRISKKTLGEFRRIRQEIKAFSGLYSGACRQARGARIIAYHGVCRSRPTRFNTLFVTERNFEDHLRLYRDHFHVISLREYCAGAFRTDRFNIALTFDDGFANNFHYVLPLLEKYQLPATFFVTAIRNENSDILWNDYVTLASVSAPPALVFDEELFRKKKNTFFSEATGLTLAATVQQYGFATKQRLMQMLQPYTLFKNKTALLDYWLQMSEHEIRAASRSPLITIGSHGYFHNDLSRLTAEEAATEMRASRTYLEALTGKPVNYLAFPYGNYSPAVLDAGKQAGYQYLFATSLIADTDRYHTALKERMGINPFISAKNQLYAITKGNYGY